jgi:ubiquinone/menaquinone biosynthesis C-methylase UbiE
MNKYKFGKYVKEDRWASYWHQINEVLAFEPDSILIVGKGDGIVPDVLKKYCAEIKTLDFDAELKPDIAGSAENMPVKDKGFDVVLCAEVLEHLSFEKFEKCLNELKRVSKKGVVLSLPHFGPPIKFAVKTPFIKEKKIAVKIPYMPRHPEGGEHYWEIGKKGYSAGKIRKMIGKYFKIKKEFVPFENQYHHFFILNKL